MTELFARPSYVYSVMFHKGDIEIENPYADRTYVYNLELQQNSGRAFARVELV